MTPFTWNFCVSQASDFSKHSNSDAALSVSWFRSPGKRNTCGLARRTNLFRGTATLYAVQFVMLRLPAHPELDHCRDALGGHRNGSHPVRYLVVARVHWQQQPATDPLKECECKFGGLTSASTASIWPTTLHAFVDSGHSLSAGPNTDMKSSVASLSLRITLLSSQQVTFFCAT